MLTHEQLMKACLFVSEEGHVFEVDTQTEELTLVFTTTSVNPEYLNLFRASAVMYQTIHHQLEAVEFMLAASIQNHIDALVMPFEAMKKSLTLTKAAVLEGIENVVKTLKEESVTKVQ
jgi:hypothetical protein